MKSLVYLFLVYQLQQEAPHPRRITCTSEVGMKKILYCRLIAVIVIIIRLFVCLFVV
uniref:Uncharacterized protein n=1 Tax=Laticauda laticaudata TaxID=8630 RepID=A0A8C5WQP3_LATLA